MLSWQGFTVDSPVLSGSVGLAESVEFRHGHRLRAGTAGTALDGILDDQPFGPAPRLGAVHFKQVRPEAGMVLAQSP